MDLNDVRWRAHRPKMIDEQNKALKIWMTGATFTAIGEQMGISRSTAYQRVQAAIEAMKPHADYDKYRATQLAELEVSRQIFRQVIVNFRLSEDSKKKSTFGEACKAFEKLIQLQEREAKLVGLDRVGTPADELTGLSDEDIELMMATWAETEAMPEAV